MESILGCSRNAEDDYYRLLGCDSTATSDQILAEFRARVLDVHPDKNPDDVQSEESFKKLLNAKQVLTDSEKRKTYDTWRCSGIVMPFEQWLALGKNSQMNDLMLEDRSSVKGSTSDTATAKISNSGAKSSTSPNQTIHADLNAFRWSSGEPSEALRKFRAYEI